MPESSAGRTRLVLVTRNLPPLRGGMERLNLHVAIALSEWADLVVVGPEGCRQHLPASVRVVETRVRPLGRFLLGSAIATWRHARTADVVLAGSGLTAPAAVAAAWRAGGRPVAYLHGLDIVAPHPIYRRCWLPALRRLAAAIVNSANTARLARERNVANGAVSIVHPGTELPTSTCGNGERFRERFSLGQAPLLLSVGRLTERKGLPEFIERALPKVVARHPAARLVVIGDEAPDALGKRRSDDVASRLESAVRRAGMESHVQRLGVCDDATLNDAYAAAGVHVFPVKYVPGDVEGFGMVAIEAAARGLLTVAFDVGGVGDAVAEGTSGFLVRSGEYGRFADRVCDILDMVPKVALTQGAREYARGFSWERFGAELRAVIEPIAIEARRRRGGRQV